jgi:(p)ppGpp synthase/HD superfamily hydrolase
MTKPLTERFGEALKFAFELHQDQYRKGSQTPYISHLLCVTAIVLEHGGSEDQAIAALLHDAVEDQGGYETLAEIKEHFGSEVAEIVEDCTDAYTTPKPRWRERKTDYLEKLKGASEKTILVSLADKIHNARSIKNDLEIFGEDVWNKFNGGKEGTLWYYQSLVDIFLSSPYPTLTAELKDLVSEITILAKARD